MKKIIISLDLYTAVLFTSSYFTTFKRKSDDKSKIVNVNGIAIDIRESRCFKIFDCINIFGGDVRD